MIERVGLLMAALWVQKPEAEAARACGRESESTWDFLGVGAI